MTEENKEELVERLTEIYNHYTVSGIIAPDGVILMLEACMGIDPNTAIDALSELEQRVSGYGS